MSIQNNGLELLLGTALETFSDGLLICDAEGLLVFSNPAAGLCFASELVPGLPLSQLGLGLDPKQLAQAVQQSQLQLNERRVLCRSEPLRRQQHYLGCVITLKELGSQSEQQQLQQNARFLDSIFENIPDMIFVKEASELRFHRFNKAGENLLGIPREDLIGRNDYDFFPKEQADFFVARDRHTLASKTVIDIPEEPLETRHGLRWLHTKKIPILDDQGEPLYLLGISADITAQKQAEEALLRINEELERRVQETVATLQQTQEQLLQSQKMEALGRLAGGVAHDFNNLLTVITGYGELVSLNLQAGSEPDKYVEQILQAAQRAGELTRQMLAFSRQQFLQPRILYLNERVIEINKLLQRLIIGEDIDLVILLEPKLAKIQADPSQMDQVIMNLAVNARDAMPKGGKLTIETKNVYLDEHYARSHSEVIPGHYVMLAVSDTGCGMTSSTLKRLFEPFFTTKDKGKGTGLGLATAYGIVKQSLGHIHVYSELNQGSVFKVYLPTVDGEHFLEQPLQSFKAQAVAGETILLVEDEPAVCELLSDVLSQAGYQVLSASQGQAALELAAGYSEQIDLLITDLVMPVMGGRVLAEQLSQQRPGLKILYMSGYTDDALVHHGKLETGVQFIHKPFSPDTLLLQVQQVLHRS